MNVLPILLSLLAAGPVEVHIELKGPTPWVGEALPMDVRWTALTRTTVQVEQDDLCFGSTRLLVEGPGRKGVYRERQRERCEAPRAPRPMEAGEEASSRLLFFGLGGWLAGDLRSTAFEPSLIFPQPGEYRLRLVYIGGKADILSNVIQVHVEMPAPEEKLLLDQIRIDPTITYHAREWLQRFPNARYLAWSRFTGTGRRLFSGSLTPDRKAEMDRRLDIVKEILTQNWGQFEEYALALAYRGAVPAGKDGLAAEIAAKLLAKYPDSKAVRELGLKEQGGGGAR